MDTITCPAALVHQGSLKLYATALKVSDLKRPHFYNIDNLDPGWKGRSKDCAKRSPDWSPLPASDTQRSIDR